MQTKPSKYQLLIKESVMRWVLTEFGNCDSVANKGGVKSVIKKIEEMGLRKCPVSGWNVGTKVYVTVITGKRG